MSNSENQVDEFPLLLRKSLTQDLESGEQLNSVLSKFVQAIEKAKPQIIGSILLLDDDGRRLRRGAAPSLPESYSQHIDGIEIGPNVGSCGTAAYCEHSIFVVDIAADPLWEAFRGLALAHGLKACWSVPVISKNKKVLGTMAMYYRDVRSPDLESRKFIDSCAELVAELIEKYRRNSNAGVA
jgi:GAF domain-containing protein